MKKLIFFLSISILSSCGQYQILPDDRKPTGDKFAVIAGVNNELSIEMASVMTEGLKRKTKFKVLDHTEIAKLIPGYPMNIQGPFKKSYMGINDDFLKTDFKKIKEIQEKLRVNYLMVVWLPVPIIQVKKNDENDYKTAEYIIQLFESPDCRNISNFKAVMAYDFEGGMIGGPNYKNIKDEMILHCKYHAENIGKRTGLFKE